MGLTDTVMMADSFLDDLCCRMIAPDISLTLNHADQPSDECLCVSVLLLQFSERF